MWPVMKFRSILFSFELRIIYVARKHTAHFIQPGFQKHGSFPEAISYYSRPLKVSPPQQRHIPPVFLIDNHHS